MTDQKKIVGTIYREQLFSAIELYGGQGEQVLRCLSTLECEGVIRSDVQ